MSQSGVPLWLNDKVGKKLHNSQVGTVKAKQRCQQAQDQTTRPELEVGQRENTKLLSSLMDSSELFWEV